MLIYLLCSRLYGYDVALDDNVYLSDNLLIESNLKPVYSARDSRMSLTLALIRADLGLALGCQTAASRPF